MQKPAPDPSKMLEAWMAWERGDNPPGRTVADLKIAGLRDVLEQLVAAGPAGTAPGGDVDAQTTESWTPVV